RCRVSRADRTHRVAGAPTELNRSEVNGERSEPGRTDNSRLGPTECGQRDAHAFEPMKRPSVDDERTQKPELKHGTARRPCRDGQDEPCGDRCETPTHASQDASNRIGSKY